MVKKLAATILFLTSISLQAQVLRDINYRYQYNPDEILSLNWEVVNEQNTYTVFYDLLINDSSRNFTDLKIQWEIRRSISDKSGVLVNNEATILKNSLGRKTGFIKFSEASAQSLIVAKVTVSENKKSSTFLFHKKLIVASSTYAATGQHIITNSFITRGNVIRFNGFNPETLLQVSYYKDAFPAGAPAFSTAQARVSKTIKPDSVFYIDSKADIILPEKGLYLTQQDTASEKGVALRIENDYPKLGQIQSLAGPLIYICTKPEYEKVKSAGNDKKKFDQVILSITGNTERARIFMRNYFKRVESANQYFSSYKEGWKTDRGMIYIIYGIPDEVYVFNDREVWEYKNDYVKERFHFVRSSTIFDPENYVLIRQKSFTTEWYKMIDLWRKARF